MGCYWSACPQVGAEDRLRHGARRRALKKDVSQRTTHLCAYQKALSAQSKAIRAYVCQWREAKNWLPENRYDLLLPYYEAIERCNEAASNARKLVIIDETQRREHLTQPLDDGLPTYVQITGSYESRDRQYFDDIRKADVDAVNCTKRWTPFRQEWEVGGTHHRYTHPQDNATPTVQPQNPKDQGSPDEPVFASTVQTAKEPREALPSDVRDRITVLDESFSRMDKHFSRIGDPPRGFASTDEGISHLGAPESNFCGRLDQMPGVGSSIEQSSGAGTPPSPDKKIDAGTQTKQQPEVGSFIAHAEVCNVVQKDRVLEVDSNTSIACEQDADAFTGNQPHRPYWQLGEVPVHFKARALHDFESSNSDSLDAKAGQIIYVVALLGQHYCRGIYTTFTGSVGTLHAGVLPRCYIERIDGLPLGVSVQ